MGFRPSKRIGGGDLRKRATQDGFDNAALSGPGAAGQIFVLLRVVSERSMARDGCSS